MVVAPLASKCGPRSLPPRLARAAHPLPASRRPAIGHPAAGRLISRHAVARRRCYGGGGGAGCAATRAAVRAGTLPLRAAVAPMRAAGYLRTATGVIGAPPFAA